jgi:hypothetical protein
MVAIETVRISEACNPNEEKIYKILAGKHTEKINSKARK